MKAYTHIIWDFNGTLLDDVPACRRAANRLLEAHGLRRLSSVEEYRGIFGFPIIDYYRRMGFDFERTPYSELAVEWVAYYLEECADAAVFPEIPSVLEAIRERGICQLILSATERGMLCRQVEGLGIAHYFDELLGLSNIHARSKEAIGLAWREANTGARILMIGDTDHDFDVARAMGADCILLTTGHQSRERLVRTGAPVVLENAAACLQYLD